MFLFSEALHEYTKYETSRFWLTYGPYIIALVVTLLIAIIAILIRRRGDIIAAARDAKVRQTNKKVERTTRVVDIEGNEVRVFAGETFSPQIPKKTGYVFGGWFVDSALTVPWLSTQPVERNMSLYPKWTKE